MELESLLARGGGDGLVIPTGVPAGGEVAGLILGLVMSFLSLSSFPLPGPVFICWFAAFATACCLSVICLESLKVTVGTLLRPGSGVLFTTAPDVPLAFMIDFVPHVAGLALPCKIGEFEVPAASAGDPIDPSGLALLAAFENRGDTMPGDFSLLIFCSPIIS